MLQIKNKKDLMLYIKTYNDLYKLTDVAKHPLHRAMFKEMFDLLSVYLHCDNNLKNLKYCLSYQRGITDNKYTRKEINKLIKCCESY